MIGLAAERVVVNPGEHADVTVTVVIPEDARPGDHVGGLAARLDGPVTSRDGHEVRINRRVRSLLTLRVDGTITPRLEVSNERLRFTDALWPLAKRWVTLEYEVRNTGNVRVGGRQSVVAASLLGAVGSQHDLDDLPELLPGESVRRVVDVGHASVLGPVRAELSTQAMWSSDEELLRGDNPGPAPAAVETVVTRSATPWLFPALAVALTLLVPITIAILWRRARCRGGAVA